MFRELLLDSSGKSDADESRVLGSVLGVWVLRLGV